jgi:hypothetical protein
VRFKVYSTVLEQKTDLCIKFLTWWADTTGFRSCHKCLSVSLLNRKHISNTNCLGTFNTVHGITVACRKDFLHTLAHEIIHFEQFYSKRKINHRGVENRARSLVKRFLTTAGRLWDASIP